MDPSNFCIARCPNHPYERYIDGYGRKRKDGRNALNLRYTCTWIVKLHLLRGNLAILAGLVIRGYKLTLRSSVGPRGLHPVAMFVGFRNYSRVGVGS